MESGSKIVKSEPGFDSARLIEADERTQQAVSLEIPGLKPVKIEQGINRALEEKILSLETEIDALKRGRFLDNQVINELNVRRLESEQREEKLKECHTEAEHSLKKLSTRVSDLEVDKKVSDVVMEVLRQEKSEADVMLKESEQRSSEKLRGLEKEIDLLKRNECSENKIINKLKTELSESMIKEMNLREKHAKAERNLEELKVIVSNLESEKRADRLIIEELRQGKSKADEIVKESRKRSLKARDAVNVSIKRLVEVNNMLAGEEDGINEHGMTGGNVVGTSDICCDDKTRNNNQGQKRQRSRTFGGDIVRAFQEDDELCIQALRELYRHVSDSERLCDKRFDHFEELWQRELADYLVKRDPDVLRPIAEVKRLFPHIVDMCRQLALEYSSYFTVHTLSVSLVCCGCLI